VQLYDETDGDDEYSRICTDVQILFLATLKNEWKVSEAGR
jgi:hypothetical protein